VLTARYALSPYLKQIRFVFKGLTLSLRMATLVVALGAFKGFCLARYHTLFSGFCFPYIHPLQTFASPVVPEQKNLAPNERMLLQQIKLHLLDYLNSRTNFPKILDSAPTITK
jgi:hypothetical protein